jgi:1,4-alpha-glucan branching enzyme
MFTGEDAMVSKANVRKTNRRKITFSIEAAHAKEVYLVGEFNGWDSVRHPMASDANGHWSRSLMLPAGKFEYKFLVDDEWVTDPNNERTCPNCFGTQNNIVNVVA